MTALNDDPDKIDDDLELEIVDLGDFENELEGNGVPSWPQMKREQETEIRARTALKRRPSFWRDRRVQLPIVVTVFLLGTVGLLLMSNGWLWFVSFLFPPRVSSSTSVLSQGDACISAADLSPNQQVIAVLEREYCNFSMFARADDKMDSVKVKLFDAHSQKLLNQFSLAQAIREKASTLNLTAQEVREGIFYLGISWSPDGKKLICAFQIVLAPQLSPTREENTALRTLRGLVLVDFPLQLRVFLQPGGDVQSGNFLYLANVWDIQQETLIQQESELTHISAEAGVQWDSDGYLITRADLAPTSLAVGSPRNGSFTFWQPGNIHVITSGASAARREYVWSSLCITWAPGDRYLAVLYWNMRLNLPGNTGFNKEELRRYSLENIPAVNVHDPALALLAKEEEFTQQRRAFALRPDGRMLAAFNRQNNHLELYDCMTGRLIKSDVVFISSDMPMAINAVAYSILQWSPDGKTLFLALRSGTMRLWQGHNLPM